MTIPSSNPQTFGWIKAALGQSMLNAMDAITDAERSSDFSKLDSVPTHLHQIQGSLQMVELDAASLFAEDLEALTAKLLVADYSPDHAKALPVLKTGLDHLKYYLNAIENQNPQTPLVLVDDINTVRELTGRRKISPLDLFAPSLELTDDLAVGDVIVFPSDKRRNILFHLRKRFRQALVAWLSDRDRDHALDMMRDLMSHLQKIGGPEVLQQLWWVAAGFVESIKKGNVVPGPEVKAQFAQLDKELSRMREDRLSDIVSSPPDELIRHMLYFIGNAYSASDLAVASDSERSKRIWELLSLDKWFMYDSFSAFDDEYGQLVNAIEELSLEITPEDISHLENKIDRYFSGEYGAEEKIAFFEDLDTLRRTLDDDRFGVLKDFVLGLCDATQNSSIEPESLIASGADIKVATAFLMPASNSSLGPTERHWASNPLILLSNDSDSSRKINFKS